MKDPIARDKRKAIKLARIESEESGYKQGQGYIVRKDDEIKALKAQLDNITLAVKSDTEHTTESPKAMFAALRAALEAIAAME